MLNFLRNVQKEITLPRAARMERRRDARGLPAADCGALRLIDEATMWLGRAQDFSASRDGGVARDFSLLSGWATSYPETTGYIVPTMLQVADLRAVPEYRERAMRMLGSPVI